MEPPFWRHIQKVEMLNVKTRYVLTYVSVFFVLTFSVIFFSSFKPLPKINSEFYFPDNDDTIFLYDTVYYYDTTYVYDTVYVNNRFVDTKKEEIKTNIINNIYDKSLKPNINVKNKLLMNKYLFSFDLLLSPMYSYRSFYSDHIYRNVSDIKKLSVKKDLSITTGFGVNYHNVSTTLSSGIYFANYREKFTYLTTNFIKDTIVGYRYFSKISIKVDSIPLINIDTLLATGDTVYYYYRDTNYITTLDSALVSKIDSVKFKVNDKTQNSYSYIEIPLIWSYNFYKPKLSISPQIGIIAGFFIDSSGKIVSLANIEQSVDLKSETGFEDIIISLYGGLRINYFLTKRLDFFTSAYFKQNLNTIFVDYPIISRFSSFGVGFGVRYKVIY